MSFKDKVVVVTGGAKGIGQAIVHAFKNKGASVCLIDICANPYFTGDIADPAVMDAFADKVITEFGHVDVLINNAPPLMKGIDSCTLEEFNRALSVGITAPFYLTQRFLPYFTKNAAIVNICSTRAFMSQPQTESYSAAKGGLDALTHALAISLSGKVRVNAVSPGWIDTQNQSFSGADAAQHPAGRVGVPEDIVEMVLFLCSEKSGFITGQNFVVDGGMTRQMIYSGDFGWTLTQNKA